MSLSLIKARAMSQQSSAGLSNVFLGNTLCVGMRDSSLTSQNEKLSLYMLCIKEIPCPAIVRFLGVKNS